MHGHVARIRKENLHRITTEITRQYGVIAIEDLNIIGMIKNHKIAGAIHDAAMGELHRQLDYKTVWGNGELVKVDRWYPSTKLCNACGNKQGGITLAMREWACDKCGTIHHRDHNAAINIRDEGLRILEVGAGVPTRTRKTLADGGVVMNPSDAGILTHE